MTEWLILEAVAREADELAEIDQDLFGEDSLSEATLRRELATGICFIAREAISKVEDTNILGYALLRSDEGIHDLLRLGVRPSQQGKGIGRALLHEARAACLGKMMLLVKKENQKARKLYESEGFKLEGELKDSWLMVTSS